MSKLYMLDTNICSYLMRIPNDQLIRNIKNSVYNRDTIIISAITYQEMRFGAVSKKAKARHNTEIDSFISRIDYIAPYDVSAVDNAASVKKHLESIGKPISINDIAIAGHALSLDCYLVTNNTREFERVEMLKIENWCE